MRPAETIFIAATLVSLAGYNLWPYFEDYERFYGVCTALSILGWVYAVHRLTSKRREWFYCATWVVSWWCVINALDECFGDPYEKDGWEFFFAIFTLLTGIIKYCKPLWAQKLRQWAQKLWRTGSR